jgi:hypothetical protein
MTHSACRDDWRNEAGDKTCSRYMSALIAVKLACSCLLGPFLTATQPGKKKPKIVTGVNS